MWLYNLAEEINLKLKVKMDQICEWQAARAGLLHHLLAQKMGLFQHTQGRDIQKCTKVHTCRCSLQCIICVQGFIQDFLFGWGYVGGVDKCKEVGGVKLEV